MGKVILKIIINMFVNIMIKVLVNTVVILVAKWVNVGATSMDGMFENKFYVIPPCIIGSRSYIYIYFYSNYIMCMLKVYCHCGIPIFHQYLPPY